MPYSTRTKSISGGGSIQLKIGTGSSTYVKSTTPNAKNIFNQVFSLTDNSDTFRQLLEFDTTGRGLDSSGAVYTGSVTSTALIICNESSQTIEGRILYINFGTDDDVIDGSEKTGVNFLLNGGEFLFLPHNLFHAYGSTSPYSSAIKSHTASSGTVAKFVDPDVASRPDSQTRIAIALLSSGVLINNVSNHASGDTTLTVDSNYYFKVGDIIGIIKDGTSVHEFLRITAIPSATTIDVERAVLGSTAGQLNNDTDIRLYYINEQADRNIAIKTNSNGNYTANTFFGYGRTATVNPQGIQRGSVAIRVREPAYQEFGLTGQTLSSSTGLTVSTAYDFDIVVDGHTNYRGVFTTDSSNVNWGGTSGILSKMNDLFIAEYDAGKFTSLPRISIVNGDIRVTSGSRLSTSAITLADGTHADGANMLDGTVGRIPNVDDFITQPTKFPDVYETEKIIFDDGRGGLSGGQGTGEIDYESGAISLDTFPDSTFEVSCYHSSAFSGSMLHNDNAPAISKIFARSTNPFRDANVRVISFDPEEGDPRQFTVSSKGSSRIRSQRLLRKRKKR